MQLPESIWTLPSDVRGAVLRFASEVQAAARQPETGEVTRHSRPFLTGLTAAYVGPFSPGC